MNSVMRSVAMLTTACQHKVCAESVRIEERIGLDRDQADVPPPSSRWCSSRRENKRHRATFRPTWKYLNREDRWLGSRRIGALKASSSMIATRGLSPNVTSHAVRG